MVFTLSYTRFLAQHTTDRSMVALEVIGWLGAFRFVPERAPKAQRVGW